MVGRSGWFCNAVWGEGKETRRRLARPDSLVPALALEGMIIAPALRKCSVKAASFPGGWDSDKASLEGSEAEQNVHTGGATFTHKPTLLG